MKMRQIQRKIMVRVQTGMLMALLAIAAETTPARSAPSSPAGAAAPGTTEIPKALQEIEAHYAKQKTLTAEFTQINESAALKQSKKSLGRIYVKRPDKVRWETFQPDANILVSDGRTFWFYTPPFDETEHGQLIERKASQMQSKLAQALISGRFSVAKDMKIDAQGPNRYRLTPKRAGNAGTVKRAEIEINPATHTIEKVTLDHSDGNHSVITLSKIELGKNFEDAFFVFTPPAKTDRVQE
jgi:outer membrane lipoprotein carrier protein